MFTRIKEIASINRGAGSESPLITKGHPPLKSTGGAINGSLLLEWQSHKFVPNSSFGDHPVKEGQHLHSECTGDPARKAARLSPLISAFKASSMK